MNPRPQLRRLEGGTKLTEIGDLKKFYKDKNVTVLGATGLIGSHMVNELCTLGARVKAVWFRRPPNEFTNLADNKERANLLDYERARTAVKGSEIVMDCAGVTGGVGLAVDDPTAFVGSNAVLGANVLEACYKEGVARVGFLSSTVVYPPLPRPVKEDDLDMRSEPYPLYFGIAWVKRFLEKLCEFYYKKVHLNIGLIRPSGAYGMFDNFDESTSHVLPALITRAFREKKRFVLWGDGTDVRDLVHAHDVVRGLVRAVILRPDATPINIASGRPVTTFELAKMVLEAVGSKARIELDTSKPTALHSRTVDITKARMELGYEPTVKLEDGIKDTVEWFRNRGDKP